MPLSTTVIGSYPKPEYLKVPDWFKCDKTGLWGTLEDYQTYYGNVNAEEHKKQVDQAKQEVIAEQEELGIDVITDGEIERENYIFHFLRRLEGFDFVNMEESVVRSGNYKTKVPTVRSKIFSKDPEPWVHKEWQETQSISRKPVKVTLPGPMTIMGSTANVFYEDEKELSLELVKCLNREIRALSEAGCVFIQVDEPLIARKPEKALEYGIDHLKMCFEGVGDHVKKVVHLCCGYPSYLDQTDYLKADPLSYQLTAQKLDEAGFDQISLEDAHRHNDLTLFNKFKKTTIILGVVTIANSKVETVDDIRERVTSVLRHIPEERLILAPDCGLAFLPKNILRQKLKNMVAAVKAL